jgi:hypothetical protein
MGQNAAFMKKESPVPTEPMTTLISFWTVYRIRKLGKNLQYSSDCQLCKKYVWFMYDGHDYVFHAKYN